MAVDRVEVSASCGMEPFLPLGSVVRIGVGGSHWTAGSFFVSSQCGIAFWCGIQCHGRVEGLSPVGECPKKSFFMICNS